MRRDHLPTVLCLLGRKARLFLSFLSHADSATGFPCRKAARHRLAGPKPIGGDHIGAHLTGGPQAPAFYAAHWVWSVGENVFVIRHRIHVVAGFAGPRPLRSVWRRTGGGQRRGAVPLAQVAKDFSDHSALVNHGNDLFPEINVGYWA